MIKRNFNENTQVLEVIYEGDICSEDILDHARFISEDKKLPRKLKIITDARDANYKFNAETAKEVLQYLKVSLTNYEFIKSAFIHSKPRETAYSMITEIMQNHNNYEHKVFSTKQAALNWLE